jgi:hypothetical protein
MDAAWLPLGSQARCPSSPALPTPALPPAHPQLFAPRASPLAPPSPAASKKVWDVVLTVEESGEGAADMVGESFTLQLRQVRGGSGAGYGAGMCKIGRSTGDDFKGAKGVSLSRDYSVSTWHGKVRARAGWGRECACGGGRSACG